MAFINDQHEQIKYSYLTTLYKELNEAREKFGFSSDVSSGKKKYDIHTASDISTLNDYINEMQSNAYLKDIAISNEVPKQYEDYIIPYYLNSIYDIIQTIKNTCNHNPCDCHTCNECAYCYDSCHNCYDGASSCNLDAGCSR